MHEVTAHLGWGWGLKKFALASALAVAFAGGLAAHADVSTSRESVIVRIAPGSAARVARDVERVGGRVTRRMDVVGALEVDTPARSTLSTIPGVLGVTPNARVRLLGDLGYDALSDTGSLYEIARIIGAPALWSRGITGAGIDVALIDSGIAPVQGLDGEGKVVHGPDISFDSQAPNLAHLDTFGHGTHMASIIAGRDSDATAPYNDPWKFNGIAPDARLLSVKVAAADGSTDVSQILAAIDWVVEHKNDHGLNVRVLNLSFGTDSAQSYLLDPLAYAVEVAWHHGIVVVASAGNAGASASSLTDPAYDPYVIAVGADDPMGTESISDDTVASFSSKGNATRRADVIAPGKSVIGLAVPNSYVADHYPSGQVGTRFFRGSGTSQAAAVTSGAVALLLQQRPKLSPDEVKASLRASGRPVKSTDPTEGNLLIDVAHRPFLSLPLTQAHPRSRGTGTLEGARGTSHVYDNGVALTGERDIFGKVFDSDAWAAASAQGSTWSGGTWNGSTWSGSTWSGSTWSGSTWSGSTWSGSTWSSHNWSGSTWSGSTWSGSTWSGSTWSGSTWSGSTWSTSWGS